MKDRRKHQFSFGCSYETNGKDKLIYPTSPSVDGSATKMNGRLRRTPLSGQQTGIVGV